MAGCNPDVLFGPKKRGPLHMGASTYTGWANPNPAYGLVTGCQAPLSNPWGGMLTQDRIPAIGQYDEREQSVTDWRLGEMQRGGIEWTTYQHEWSMHLNQLVMNHCAENHPADSPVQFAMSWWDVQSAATDPLNLRYWDSTYWDDGRLPVWNKEILGASFVAYGEACRPIMRKASYLRVDGKPVLFRGYANTLQFYARWGLTPKEILDLVSEGVGERPYFVATSCDLPCRPSLKAWGFDALTEYCLNADSWANLMSTYRDFWRQGIQLARDTGIDYWIPATAGFDARGYLSDYEASKLGYSEPPTPDDFTAHLIEARQVAEANYDVTRGKVLSYAFTERFEGGIIEPNMPTGMIHNGDEMLLAHAAACDMRRAA